MANKREFKKNVEAIGASACAPMMEIYQTLEEDKKETVEKAVAQVLGAVAAARSNADITFDKGVKAFENLKEYSKAKKDFYKKLFGKISDDFSKELEEALKLFNSAVPEEVKAENKAAAGN